MRRWLVPGVGGVAVLLVLVRQRHMAAASRLQDHATQSSLRKAVTYLKMYWMETGRFPSTGEEFASVDVGGPPLVCGDPPVDEQRIYGTSSRDSVTLSARSGSGKCFYLCQSSDGMTSYGVDRSCRPSSEVEYLRSWDEPLSWAQQKALYRRLDSQLWLEPLRQEMRELFGSLGR